MRIELFLTGVLSLVGSSTSWVAAFTPPLQSTGITRTQAQTRGGASLLLWQSESSSSTTAATSETETASSSTTGPPVVDPKEAVKIFGRLAEKYIMLDETAGMCCYSGCSDCEYRLPGGGYRMADQSAARPKWIPSYAKRSINGKEHVTKWSAELFREGETALDQATFCQRLVDLTYAPPLGGPYVAASGAAIVEDSEAAQALFRALADGKEKLTKTKMSVRIKQLADGEEGLTWPKFQIALGL